MMSLPFGLSMPRAHLRATRRLCAAGFALSLWGVVGPAPLRAEPPPASRRSEIARPRFSVGIEFGDCSVVAADDVLFLARIELRGQLSDASSSASCRVNVTCSGARVAISARTSDGRERAHDTDLSSVSGSVRPRVVALTIAELIHDLEVSSLEPPEVEPIAPSGPPIQIPPQAPSRAITLGAFAAASAFRFDPKWLVGGGIGGAYARGHLVAGIDATLTTRDERSEAGSTQVLLTYLGPYLGWRASAHRFTGQWGGGYAFGVARITGRATDASAESGSLSEFWGAPFAFASITYAPSDVVSIGLRAHAGWVTLPVVGLVWKGPSIDLTGFWSGAELGVALAL
jgi:hypothetical protein